MESAATTNPGTPKVGRIRKGWQLTKSSWHVLKLDKELASLPLLSLIWSLIVLIPFGVIALLSSNIDINAIDSGNFSTGIPTWEAVLLSIGVYFATTLVASFFGGALIYGATERFNGGDPTVRSSIAGARRKFRPLVLFSLMMTTVGLVLQFLEDRLPFAGAIAVWIFDAAWNVANIFAIPVIVLSEKQVGPLEATKESVRIVKKIWGESIVVNLGIGLICSLSILAYILIGMVAGTGIAAIVGPSVHGTGEVSLVAGTVIIAVLVLFALMLVFTALSSIAKAALYHYATTGEAPATFDKKLLQASLTPKKARKIFS